MQRKSVKFAEILDKSNLQNYNHHSTTDNKKLNCDR